MNSNNKYDLAKEFQDSVTECLEVKCEKAIDYFKKKYKKGKFIFAGGVASNEYIRNKLKTCEKNYKICGPRTKTLCRQCNYDCLGSVRKVKEKKKVIS